MKSCLSFHLKNKQLHTSWMLFLYEKHLIATEPTNGSSLRNAVNSVFFSVKFCVSVAITMFFNRIVQSWPFAYPELRLLSRDCRVRLTRTQVNK